jgi:acetyltransferase-like isoleucine patch superfamily enzyme
MNYLRKGYRFAYNKIWTIFHRMVFLKLGNRVVIKKPIEITPEYISVGDGVTIMHHARLQGISNYLGIKYNPRIVLGEGVSIQQNLHLTCARSVSIGSNTAIAANVTITDIHHPYEDISKPIEHQELIVKEVFIDSDCKIYNNAVILPGVHIGKHSTIGANSVVTGDISDFSVAVGIPARIVKRYNPVSQKWEKTKPDGSFIE